MLAYVQAAMDFDPKAYDQIAEAIGTKTAEEVAQEIRCYRDAAIERVLNSANPWEMEFSRNRQGNFSREADSFLVICVETKGRIDG